MARELGLRGVCWYRLSPEPACRRNDLYEKSPDSMDSGQQESCPWCRDVASTGLVPIKVSFPAGMDSRARLGAGAGAAT